VTAPYIYDPTVGDWTFDTSSLRNLDAGGLAGALALNFGGRAHLVAEVDKELPATSVFKTSRIVWFDVQTVTLPAEQTLYNLLRLRWGSAPGKDGGEAAAITLCAARGYKLVCDDGVGFRAAESVEARVCTMRTTSLIVAMARALWITPDEGWTAILTMQAAGRTSLGPIPWSDRAGYDALCAVVGFDACRFDPPAGAGTPAT
jgi:hypothetical protein